MTNTQENTSEPYNKKNKKIRRALISVSDKTGIEAFARKLSALGIEILSTGGTAKALSEAGISVTDVSSYTGFPEIMEGRVKTLHPKVHGGILGKHDNPEHMAVMDEHGIQAIDMVVTNLYPFVEMMKSGKDFPTCIENIDIGGPAMIRASAKNHAYVAVVTDPQDYAPLLEEMAENDGSITYKTRRRLAFTAFSLTATYDSSISSWLASQIDEGTPPRRISFSGTLKQTLRYGENPHQNAALYLSDDMRAQRPGAALSVQRQGKELSYNNLADTDAAFELVAEFDDPAVAIIKHSNPCGVAVGGDVTEVYKRALSCDQESAFGGIIALNRPLTAELASLIVERFVEVIIAPSIEESAFDALRRKSNIRVLESGGMPERGLRMRTMKRIAGGLLVQDADNMVMDLDSDSFRTVTDREPTGKEMEDLLFAFTVAKHVKSNAIVYAKDITTVGIGAGQMSRIDSCRIAVMKAARAAEAAGWDEPLTKGSVVASDAFFPFADGLLTAADAGVSAVIQPGGSIRDQEVIDAANERGLAMVFTGLRHFNH